MKIRLGLALDGASHMPAANRLGALTTGPKGLLSLLEGELGLSGPAVSHTVRVTQYAKALRTADTGARFYSESIKADLIGVARELLDWRDTLRIAGWQGQAQPDSPPRIQDLAAVETAAREVLAKGTAERLQAVEDALGSLSTQITGVELADPMHAFALRWQAVLGKLPTTEGPGLPASKAGTDLHDLQTALLGMVTGSRTPVPVKARHDGSVTLVRSSSVLRDARGLLARINPSERTLILAAQDVDSLVDAFEAAGLPTPASASRSPARPALQLLPLALQLCWAPLDVTALLGFLSHPLCPLHFKLAVRLAQTLAGTPGIGSDAWKDTIKTALQELHPDDQQKQGDALAFWVEGRRHPKHDGLPAQRAQELATKLVARLSGRARTTEDASEAAALNAALVQCQDFAQGIDLLGKDTPNLTPTQVQQLLDLASEAAPSRSSIAQLDHTPLCSQPGAMTEPVDRVIWWQAGQAPLAQAYPWSSDELAAFARMNVRLPSIEQQLGNQASDWIRPVLAATQSITIVLPPEGMEAHPIIPMARYALDGIAIQPEDALITPLMPAMTAERFAPLPALRRWWKLPPDVVIPKRKKESYSSVNTLIENPYRWVLNYTAHIRTGDVLDLCSGPRLAGTLLHRMTERFFAQENWRSLSKDAVHSWFSRDFDTLVDQEGAVLRQPGKQAELTRLRSKALTALTELLRQLKTAGVLTVESEKSVAGRFCGGDIQGFADLVVTNAQQQMAIIDLKLGKSGYADTLADNTHLQLTIYAKLLGNGGYLPTAYFILNAADLIAQTNHYFPAARTVQNKSEESAADLWMRFETSWKHRRAELDEGAIEVITESTAKLCDQTPLDGGMPQKTANDTYNDHLKLAGWKAGA